MQFSERISCSIKEAVEATGISRSQIYVLMDGGKIAFAEVSGRRRIFVPSLLALLGPRELPSLSKGSRNEAA